MGCDGGTIPKRKEIVKNKERRPRQQRDRSAQAAQEWKDCAICDWKLTKPIVAGQWGHIFCKECVLRHLIDYRRGALSAYHLVEDKAPKLNSLHTMKDIKVLKLKEKDPEAGSSQASTNEDTAIKADFVCPITGLETNGKHKFVFSWNCGCVVSERATKEVPNDNKCLVCQEPYREIDLIVLNPDKKDLEPNQAKFLVRKMTDHMRKEGLDLDSSHSSRDDAGPEDAEDSHDDDKGAGDNAGTRDADGWLQDVEGLGNGGTSVAPRPKGPSEHALLRKQRQERQKRQRSRPQADPVYKPSTSGLRPSGSRLLRSGETSAGHDRRRAHDDDGASSSAEQSQSKKQRP